VEGVFSKEDEEDEDMESPSSHSNRNFKTLEPEYVWWLDDDVVDEPASNVDTPSSNVVDMAWKQLELLGDSDH
jgi:hypothetical protein